MRRQRWIALQYEMQRPELDDHLVLTETREQCNAATLGEDDFLDGLDVLPGFSCAVRAVFGG